MIDKRISYEETYVSDIYNTTTGYFTIDKSLLEELSPIEYPEAEYGTISIEYPTDRPKAKLAMVMISPTKDDTDYCWRYIDLPYKFIDELIGIIHSADKRGKYLSICNFRKVLYLATHSKKYKTRKKNMNRAIKILQEIPMS